MKGKIIFKDGKSLDLKYFEIAYGNQIHYYTDYELTKRHFKTSTDYYVKGDLNIIPMENIKKVVAENDKRTITKEDYENLGG